jgi:hypothetical protein
MRGDKMIEFPLYPGDLHGGTILSFSHAEPNEIKVKLLDGRIAKIIPVGDEFETTYMGDYE